ncbi:MAG: peroxiredoxin [Candidatus Nanopelagicales bacterium]|nr:peroxiredoxin [Candidatus Nanopelagicales bacterium]
MSVSVGDSLPDVELRMMVDGSPATVSSIKVLGSGRVVLFAVPGAFTPGCSNLHFPGYVELASSISAAGVDTIACVSVNDVFVMDAWGKAQGAGEILMLADSDAAFAKALEMDVDASGFGLGIRSKRYALVLEDGVVAAFLPEEDGFSVLSSTAACVLAGL